MYNGRLLKRLLPFFLAVLLAGAPMRVAAVSTDDWQGLQEAGLSAEGSEEGTNPEQPSEGGEEGSSPEQPSEGGEEGSSPEQPSEGSEEGSSPEQPSEGGEEGSSPEQPSEGGEEGTDPEQPSEGGEEGSNSEQPSEGGEEGSDPEQEAIPFSCYTVDAQGRQINAFWSEESAAWYLFIPSAQAVADTVLYYTGSITAVSSGQVDTENASVTGAFASNGAQVALTAADETVHNVIVMQSQLPSVHITLNGVTLDQVHEDKEIKYKGNSISITEPSGEHDLTVEGSLEFKGRGNSTWTFYDKKGYQIKFSEKTSVLGMGKSKTWILLANAADETLLHNMLAYTLASDLNMDYVTDYAYVDLWIDGEYRGNYILGEKIEIGSGRVDLQDENGTIFEHDQGFYYEEDYWLYNDRTRKYFTVKDTNADEDDAQSIQVIMDSFQDSLNELMTYLYDTNPDDVTIAELETLIDVDSFAKFYLVNEYTCNKESTASSFYWYKDGLDDILHLGPVWDFDSCMGNTKNEEPYYMESHVLFNRLLTCPAFYDRTVEIYTQNQSAFAAMLSHAAAFDAQIASSAAMNFIRWNVWGEPNPKYTLNDYSASYEEGYAKLASWLSNRASSFAVQHPDNAFAYVNDDCTTMEIRFDPNTDYASVQFAVWSDNNGQDDLKWYTAEKNAEGVWTYLVDLSAHQTTGKYTIHVHGTQNGAQTRVAVAHCYVEKTNDPKFSAALSEDGYGIEVTARNVGMYTDLSVHVWCDTDGNGDLAEYTVETQADHSRTCLVELRNHDEVGEYHVQLYGKSGSSWVLVGETSVAVDHKNWPMATAEVFAEQKTMVITVDSAEDYSDFEFRVWGDANGRDDAATYDAVRNSAGAWTVTVDLDAHEELGTYQVHVYGTQNGVQKRVAIVKIEVAGIVFPSESVLVYRLYNPYTNEHLLTANEAEADQLAEAGWQLDGIAWNASKTGTPVYRLYNPYDDWHTYTTSQEEISVLTQLGWTVDGIVFSSTQAANKTPVYRLFNPYEEKNYHLLTASEEERAYLISLGWTLDGVALNAVLN